MNMRTIILACSAVALAAISGSAQVVIRGTQSSDKSDTSAKVDITTSDRTIVPLTQDTKETKVDATTQRTESTTRCQLADGSYFDWQHSTTVKKEVAPGKVVTSTDLVEQDRQGQGSVARHTDETVTKTATGQIDQTRTFTINSSGKLVLDDVVDANTVKGSDGGAKTTRMVRTADVNGNLTLEKQIDEVAVDHGANGKVVTATTRTVDHLSGELKVTGGETTTTTTQGGAKQMESVTRIPGPNGWQVSGRTTTTEKTAPDGSVSRETIEQERPVYSPKSGDDGIALVPQRKVVEHQVQQGDGRFVVQRDQFHRDANGGWVADVFSTQLANKVVQP